MFNSGTLKTSLLGLVGIRQNENPLGEQLTTAVTASRSGLYANDEHALLTFDNLKSIAPIYEDIYSTWNTTDTYVLNDIVYYSVDRLFYKALAGSTNLIPPDNATEWEVYSPLSVWLQQKIEGATIRALNLWLDTKIKVKTARNLLNNAYLYQTTGAIESTSTDKGYEVGIQIVGARSIGTKMRVSRIGVRFDTVQADLVINLFSALAPSAAVQTTTVQYTTAGDQQWFSVDWNIESEGAYYIAYDQTALGVGVKAINGAFDYAYNGNGQQRATNGKYYNAVPFELNPSETVGGVRKFSAANYVPSDNFGLNLRLDVRCDYTNFITDQELLFQHAISKQIAIDLLNDLANNANARVNRNQVNVDKAQIIFEIEDNSPDRAGGLKSQLDSAIDSITIDFNDVDSVCLPCRKRSIRYRAT